MTTPTPVPSAKWIAFCPTAVAAIFRLAGLVTLVMLLAFPPYKGRPEGWIPLVVSAGAAGIALSRRTARFRDSIRKTLDLWPPYQLLALALGVPALLQVGLVFWLRPSPTFDGLFVLQEAERLARTGNMSLLTYYGPGQIWYYALVFKLFGATPLTAQLGQLPLFLGMILAFHGIARRALPLPAARAATLAMAFYPSMILYALVTPYYFYLYTLLLLFMIGRWLAVATSEGGNGAAFAGGLAAGFGALTKAVLLVAPLQALAFWLLSARSFFQRRLWVAWLLFVLGTGVVIAPWAWRNQQVFGEPILVCTSGPLVLWSANNPDSDGLYSPLPDQKRIETPTEMLRHMRYCRDQAKAFILFHPGRFLRLALRKLLHTWGTETTYVELINRNGKAMPTLDPILRFVAQAGWGALVMLWAFVALRALIRRHPAGPIELAAAILVLTKWVVYSFYEGGARHHLPVVPLLILYVVSELYPPRNSSATL
jgi:4-amino-4-deoxy-L-arabinose transferase-like glycosyltransferase